MVFINFILNRNTQNMIGYGDKNDLLYSIPEDMKWFKKITTSSPNSVVIMGYNTWKSIPKKPLPLRKNVIITKHHYTETMESISSEDKETLVADSYETAIRMIEADDISYENIYVIGGEQLYNYILDHHLETLRCIYETKVSHLLWDTFTYTFKFCNIPISEEYVLWNHFSKHCKGKCNLQEYSELQEFMCDFNIFVKQQDINTNEKQYIDLLKKICEQGNVKSSRNSDVTSIFGEKMVFDLRKGFPLLTTKKMGWKTILRELLWFISGSTNNKELQEKNVHIWDQNASAEFLESRGLFYEEGDLGPVYGFQWRHFGASYEGVQKDYKSLGIDQLQNVIDLIKNDPASRRIIMSAWNPCDLDKMALPPCHVMVQFNIEGEYIDAQLYQRSGDMFLGVPYNIASYSFLLHIIGTITGYVPRFLHHVLGDAHIYNSHLEVVNEQVNRVPLKSPKLSIQAIDSLDDIHESKFMITDYQSYNALKADMIA